MRSRFLACLAGATIFALAAPAHAQFVNSLWIGTGATSTRSVLNTDLSGNLLRSVGPVESTGFALNMATNTIYFGTSAGLITPRDLTTLAPGSGFTPTVGPQEDMTFDSTGFIWRADDTSVEQINPGTHTEVSSFDPGMGTLVGIAWDGTGLWVGQDGNLIKRFNTSGTATGQSFTVPFTAGGLAFDPLDGTLFIGSTNTVFHYTTTGSLLGSFTIPVTDGRFVDGLEFEGAQTVPEPGSLLLISLAGGGFAMWRLRTRRKAKAAAAA